MVLYLLLVWSNGVDLLCFAFIVSEFGNNSNISSIALSVMLGQERNLFDFLVPYQWQKTGTPKHDLNFGGIYETT